MNLVEKKTCLKSFGAIAKCTILKYSDRDVLNSMRNSILYSIIGLMVAQYNLPTIPTIDH